MPNMYANTLVANKKQATNFLKPIEKSATDRLDLPLVLLLLGFNLVFLGLALVRTGTIERIRLVVPVGYACIIFGSFMRLPKDPSTGLWRNTWFRNWFLLFAVSLIVMVIRSLADGTDPSMIFFGSVPYLFILLVFVGHKRVDWLWINRLLVFHVTIGLVLVSYAIVTTDQSRYFVSGSAARQFVLSDTTMHDTLALMYGYPFLILTYSQQSKYGRAAAIAATAVTVIAGVFGQFRGTVLMPVIYLGLTYFAARRTHSLSAKTLLLPVSLTFILFVSLFQFSYVFGSNLLGSNINGLRARFEDGFVEGVGVTERVHEARYVLADLQPYDLLTGKGVAGTWDSTRYVAYSYYRYGMLPGYEEEDREMAHFGPAHMILKGGLPLLLLYLFFPFLIGWKRFITSRHPFTLAASAVVVAYSLQWLVAVFPSASLSYAMVMLCAGQCISRDDSTIA